MPSFLPIDCWAQYKLGLALQALFLDKGTTEYGGLDNASHWRFFGEDAEVSTIIQSHGIDPRLLGVLKKVLLLQRGAVVEPVVEPA